MIPVQVLARVRPLCFALVLAGALCSLLVPSAARTQSVPEIPFDGNINFLKLPDDLHLGEVVGVSVNSKGHLFVFSRTGERSTLHGATASQLFEFGPDGTYLREIGKNVGSSRVDLQACKLEYSIVSPK